jgi:PAS domain S-box-containing protein
VPVESEARNIQMKTDGDPDQSSSRDYGGDKKGQNAPPGKSTPIEQEEARTEQANMRTDETNARTEQAETRTAEANTRTEQADLRTKKAEAQSRALHASELSYRRLFESARDGILILDVETGRIVDVNPFLVELLGFSRDGMVGKTVGELSPFKDVVANRAMLERLQKDGYVRYEDLPLETRDGRYIAVEFVSNVYQAGDEKVIQCNIRDISERKQAEAALRESEEQFRAMFEVASIGMSQTDPRTGQWVRVNRKLCDITGYAADELLRMRFSEITHPDDRQADCEAFQQVVRGEVPDYHIEKRYLRKDGTEVWVNVNMSLMRDAAGQPVRTMTTVEDITARRQAEVLLAQQLDELRRWQAVTLGREGRVGALKREVNALAVRLGQPPPYGTPEDGEREKNG